MVTSAFSVFRVLTFGSDHARFVDYGQIAKVAREVGCAFTVRWADEGTVTITIFWEGTACP